MAFLNETLNVSELPESTNDFAPIPEGFYDVTIQGAELCNTKAGTGQYINLKLNVTGPSHQGRLIFSMLNIRNQNPKAEEIGRQQLGSVCRAIGLTQISDTDQLIGGSMSVKVTISKSEQYGDRNEVKAYKAALNAGASLPPQGAFPPAAAQPAPAAQQSQQPQPQQAAAAPWAR